MTNPDVSTTSVDEAEIQLRQSAVSQLRERRDFQAHVRAYILVNLHRGVVVVNGRASMP